MINYLKEFEDALEDFLDLTIYFNDDKMQYRFQGIWTSSDYEKKIQEKADKLKYLLSKQLKNGLDNKALLSEIKLKMREAYNFLYDVYYDGFDNLSKSNLTVKKSSALFDSSDQDVFTYEFFEKKLFNDKHNKIPENEEDESSELVKSLLKFFESYQKKNNKNPTRLQFENAKLLECIYCYREMLYDLLNTINYYFLNFDKIDFSKIDMAEFDPVVIRNVKCNLSLNKKDTAKIFNFLMIEKYLYFDLNDEKKNKIQLQNFIQKNFTYKSLNLKQEDITNINKEFSESHLDHKENYNNLIEELICILESKKKT